MRPRLLFADREPRREREPRAGEADLIADLELGVVWDAMAQGDGVIAAAVRAAMLDGLLDPDAIRYRQGVLADCLAHPAVVREIYRLAVDAVADEKQVYRGFFNTRGEARISRSVRVLELFDGRLRQLRAIAGRERAAFASAGFQQFFDAIVSELDDAWFGEVSDHLQRLGFGGGVLATARLGKRGQGIDYVLHSPPRDHRLLGFLSPTVGRPSHSRKLSPRDQAADQAIGQLRDGVLAGVADAVGQATDHITQFFLALRAELGFYIGGLNLHERLAAKGEPLTMPEPQPSGGSLGHARGLLDPCLSLRLDGRVQGNDLTADGCRLIVVTGANQGGKSTFLRSLGVAQLMMGAGLFVAAFEYTAAVSDGIFTHYKREEDATMTGGKFDEELARMSGLVPAIGGGALLLCNESFAATNEREGSEIAGEVIRAMIDRGAAVVFVTHLYELAHRLYEGRGAEIRFLRADREADGSRSFRLAEGEPLATGHGEDLYRRTFSDGESARAPQRETMP
jgi:hypothetical protein